MLALFRLSVFCLLACLVFVCWKLETVHCVIETEAIRLSAWGFILFWQELSCVYCLLWLQVPEESGFSSFFILFSPLVFGFAWERLLEESVAWSSFHGNSLSLFCIPIKMSGRYWEGEVMTVNVMIWPRIKAVIWWPWSSEGPLVPFVHVSPHRKRGGRRRQGGQVPTCLWRRLRS